MSQLRPHTNVVQFLGMTTSSEDESLLCLMELCAGGSLHSLLRSRQERDVPPDMPVVVAWLRGIASGMLHLHREKIIHRE
jgi:serine/threonine protein kinase